MWMRPAIQEDGFNYYEYVLCYVDDALVVSQHPQRIMEVLGAKYVLKAGSVGEPKTYFGAKVSKYWLEHSDDPGKARWNLSVEDYINRAVKDVETELEKVGKALPTKVTTPTTADYRPELDRSRELGPEQATYFAGLIGILCWCIELGRIDIIVEVSLLSHFPANPREGHLEQALHVFSYLKKLARSWMVFDKTVPEIDQSCFRVVDWSEFYPGAEEAIPQDMPETRGCSVVTSCFVDSDHAGCRLTQQSHTGVLIFVSNAPILWYSKRQNTVESSTFGSEFVAVSAVDMIEGLWYKLRMMGIPLDGSTSVFCDNEGMVKNTTAPESPLKKKHVAICYHRCHETLAAGFIQLAKEDTKTNLADAFTKPLPSPRRKELLGRILY
jgi:hypothetical protein